MPHVSNRAGILRATVAALAACTTLALHATLAPTAAAQPGGAATAPPRLVVLLLVDQMRADYVDRFQGEWTGGLKRLAAQGARFTNAAYPYLSTFTCAGHATVATGALPFVHGIFQNTWYDRRRGAAINCTDDETSKSVVYSGKGRDDGPNLLLVPTFADEMRRQRGSRVVSVSLKARSAIMMAGHGGDAVVWMTDTFDGWQTSTAYAPAPVPAVKAYLDAHRVDADYGKSWQRLLPLSHYVEADAGEGEAAPKGWTSTFPHVFKGEGSGPDAQFHDQWQHSPFADAYLGRLAAALTDRLALGRRATTDVLAVSFSSPDLVGHQFGPDSQEVRDEYAHLDRTIGTLLARLDATVGRDRYVVALTGDHGVTAIPEQIARKGRSAGRVSASALREVAQKAAERALGAGAAGATPAYVARVVSNDVYFTPGTYAKLTANPAALDAVISALRTQPGIDRVLRSEEVSAGTGSGDAVVKAAALSYVANRSGDLILLLKPGWMFSADGTTHGSATPDDQRVPLMFVGRGIAPGLYAEAATPADVAPTLAALTGISLPKAQGRALSSALRGPAGATR